MFQAVTNKLEWNEIYKSFLNADIYYSYGYARPFEIHGQGQPMLFYYFDGNVKAINAVMKRRIVFDGEDTGFFDLATPYGYGGWIFEGKISQESLDNLDLEFTKYCVEHKIVSEFVRFHPLLKNAHLTDKIYDVVDLGNTISIALTDENDIWSEQLSSRNRTSIRKAIKSGIEIKVAKNLEIIESFKQIYDDTMRRDNAEEFYYFKDDFYLTMLKEMENDFTLYYAQLNGEIIGASIIMWGKNFVHYHLSGAKREFMNLAPMNLLLYQVALDFSKQNKQFFHLGGGVGSDTESGLYRFKESFNKNGANLFSIGKKIFDQGTYDSLVEKCNACGNFDKESRFFPLYRS